MTTSRRHFLQVAAGAAGFVAAPGVLLAGTSDISWYDAREWGVEGKGWSDSIRYFDRLPGRAKGVVRDAVWDLSRHSAGMRVRFETDASDIYVRYTLLHERLAMPHMPATGVSGLDLYAEDTRGIERWAGVLQPDAQSMEKKIVEGIRPGTTRFTMYLPLYNGVESLEIGVPHGSMFTPAGPPADKPMLFYGTSIMHGACASRPGMAIPAILGRRLKRSTLNLGLSGNGRMEPEVGSFLAELDPCVFAVDCVPNMYAQWIDERAVPLVRQLRDARPDTPILLVEDRSFAQARFFQKMEDTHRSNRAALRRAFAGLQDAGVDHLYYLDGEQLLGDDGEAAVDGSHPTDLGMVRYADAYETALRDILQQY